MVSRDVQFLEDKEWDLTEEVEVKQQEVSLDPDELVNDALVKGLDYWMRCMKVV